MLRTIGAELKLFTVVLWSAVLPLLAVDSVQHCVTDNDCEFVKGQMCYRLYDGCNVGQCMCDPHQHTVDDTGRCVRLKHVGEKCSLGDICRPGMHCRDGRCGCISSRMTPDRRYCLEPGERMLGDVCSAKTACVHLGTDGYTRSDVNCSSEGRCKCVDGFKTEGFSCKRWNINERGCIRPHHCSGGALCQHGECLCPYGYKVIASNLKCAKYGAEINIPFGATCDEINERRYCSQGLVCHQCPGVDDQSRCVRFLMANEFAYLYSGAAPTTAPLFGGHRRLALFTCVLLIVLRSIS